MKENNEIKMIPNTKKIALTLIDDDYQTMNLNFYEQ